MTKAFALAALIALASTAALAQSGDAALAAKVAKGRDVFANYGCAGCHALADAGADGHVGPAFDGNSGLTEAFIKTRVSTGQNAMPAFQGQMSDDDIAAVAAYVMAVKR